MSQAPTGAASLVRVTVASGSRRIDLVLPGAVPVAELVPELARNVGLLDAGTAYAGYRVVTADGRRLAPDSGLIFQGVTDGALLTVSAGVDEKPPRVYDDVVEAMTDVVEAELQPWHPASGRRTALWSAALLLALGAGALLAQRGTLLAGIAGVVVAAVLTTGAVVLSRTQREHEAAVAVSWMAGGYGAVAGLLLAPSDGGTGVLLAAAGAGALVAGLLCLVGLDVGRSLVLPPAVVGAVLLLLGSLLRLVDLDPAVVLTVALTVVVLSGSVFPWLALSATGTSVHQLYSPEDVTADPDEIDRSDVVADARVAHEILVAIAGTVGVLLVLVAPFAVSLGLSGVLLVVAACGVVMLRTRQYRTGSAVLVGLVSGVAGLASTAVALLVLHPEWRPAAAVVLAVGGGVVLAATLATGAVSVRRGRLGDLAETVGLLSLLPLLVLATGLFSTITG